MSIDVFNALQVSARRPDAFIIAAVMAGLVALLVVAPFCIYPIIVVKVLCFALFASAFNLLLGYGGLLSFGHAAFFGAGAYVSAYTTIHWGLSPLLAIAAGASMAAALGLVFGALAIRRQGIYFAMVTLAFAQMVYFFCLQAPFTGGEDGIQGVPRRALLGLVPLSNDRALYYFAAGVFLVSLLMIYRITHSPFGQVLKAIRENESRAISLGYRVNQYKLAVFVLSATFAGVAGALKAISLQLATLTDVQWQMSGEVVFMSLLGGVGTIFGPTVGAALVTAMQDYLAAFGGWVTIIQGIVFVLCVLLFRKGIVGVLAKKTGQPL